MINELVNTLPSLGGQYIYLDSRYIQLCLPYLEGEKVTSFQGSCEAPPSNVYFRLVTSGNDNNAIGFVKSNFYGETNVFRSKLYVETIHTVVYFI